MTEPEAADLPDLLSLTAVAQGPDWRIVSATPSGSPRLAADDGADEGLVGRSLLDISDGRDVERLRAALDGTARTQRPEQLHVRLLDRDRAPVWFEVQV